MAAINVPQGFAPHCPPASLGPSLAGVSQEGVKTLAASGVAAQAAKVTVLELAALFGTPSMGKARRATMCVASDGVRAIDEGRAEAQLDPSFCVEAGATEPS